MPITFVEFLSNLAWLAVASTLWGLWFANLCSARERSRLPAIGVQVMAIAMLTAILLPVISISDDLQASHMPAEVERTAGRYDRHLSPATLPSSLPFALAVLALCQTSLRPRVAFLTVVESAPRQMRGHFISLWSRPPPTA